MLKKLAPYTRGYRLYVMLGVLFSAGEAVLELELPQAMSEIVDVGIAGGGSAGALFRHGILVRRVPKENLLDALMEEIADIAKEMDRTL